MKELTVEEQKESADRISSFRTKYLELVEQFQVDFAAFPQYMQNQNGSFDTICTTQLIDKKYMPVPSNIMSQ